jgi:redox-sensitive bicupin YhaK (pirin superfamily)
LCLEFVLPKSYSAPETGNGPADTETGCVEILDRDKVPKSRFAGVREHRLITDPRLFGTDTGEGAWAGFGNLVYLADARLVPAGETRMHSHREIDVISVMVEGRIQHQGSLEHGQELQANEVQVQRAGGEGFSHNEINPDDSHNRLIQIWVLPEREGEPAGYRHYRLKESGLTRVYGGAPDQPDAFAASTIIDIACLKSGQSMDVDTPFLAYLARGKGFANEDIIAEGTLLRGDQLTFDCTEDAQLILAHLKG